MADLLEPEFRDAFTAWKKTPSMAANASMLKTLQPVIEGAAQMHVGETGPLVMSQARRLALHGLLSYDPARGRLKSHVYNQLLGLKRIAQKQRQTLSVPQRVAFERQQLEQAEKDLEHELGRPISDAELFDRTGFSAKRVARVRGYQPAVAEGTLSDTSGDVYGGVSHVSGHGNGGLSAWHDLVYSELDPYHQTIMERTLGMNGHKPLSNQMLAQKLRRSPGAISQAKQRIQQLLDQESELSPFSR